MNKEQYQAAVVLMDDDLRESVHERLAPCTDDEFMAAYEKAHFEKFGETFTI